jgi:hypothetical protein
MPRRTDDEWCEPLANNLAVTVTRTPAAASASVGRAWPLEVEVVVIAPIVMAAATSLLSEETGSSEVHGADGVMLASFDQSGAPA